MDIPINYDSIKSVFKDYKKVSFDWVIIHTILDFFDSWIQKTKYKYFIK